MKAYCFFAGGGGRTLFLLRQTARFFRIRILFQHLLLLDIGNDATLVVGQVVNDSRYERTVSLLILSAHNTRMKRHSLCSATIMCTDFRLVQF